MNECRVIGKEDGKWTKCIALCRVPGRHEELSRRCKKHEDVRGLRKEKSDSPVRTVKRKKNEESDEDILTRAERKKLKKKYEEIRKRRRKGKDQGSLC